VPPRTWLQHLKILSSNDYLSHNCCLMKNVTNKEWVGKMKFSK